MTKMPSSKPAWPSTGVGGTKTSMGMGLLSEGEGTPPSAAGEPDLEPAAGEAPAAAASAGWAPPGCDGERGERGDIEPHAPRSCPPFFAAERGAARCLCCRFRGFFASNAAGCTPCWEPRPDCGESKPVPGEDSRLYKRQQGSEQRRAYPQAPRGPHLGEGHPVAGEVHARGAEQRAEDLRRLGFGRIVVSDIEVPNMLVNLV
jgi:hypothetical protein